MAVGGVTELIAVSFYAFIGIRMSRLKVVTIILSYQPNRRLFLNQQPLQQSQPSLFRLVCNRFMNSKVLFLGGFMIVVVVLPDILATRLTGKAIWRYISKLFSLQM